MAPDVVKKYWLTIYLSQKKKKRGERKKEIHELKSLYLSQLNMFNYQFLTVQIC